jgi:hypothetical protein
VPCSGARALFLRQNLANAFILNWLWLPAALALVTIAHSFRKSTPQSLRRAIWLFVGIGALYVWTTFTFPTYTVPRYAVPVTLCAVLVAILGLPLYKPWVRPVVLGALVFSFMAGAWATTDPISKETYGMVSIGGEEIYNTAEIIRGPDRMLYNFATLRADRRLNARLSRLYASEATRATGDCNTLKVGEKLYSVGLVPTAYDRVLTGARPIRCVPLDELPPDAAHRAAEDRRPADARGRAARQAATAHRTLGDRNSLSPDPRASSSPTRDAKESPCRSWASSSRQPAGLSPVRRAVPRRTPGGPAGPARRLIRST